MTTAALGLAMAISSLSHSTALPMLGPSGSLNEPTISLGGSAGAISARDNDISFMLATLNDERASRGLAPLGLDPSLCRIARSYASEMATHNFFGHTSPAGDTPFVRMDRAHYRYGYAGENIALDESPTSAAAALWRSNAHRENILEPHYARVGIGAIRSSAGEIFVEDFSD